MTLMRNVNARKETLCYDYYRFFNRVLAILFTAYFVNDRVLARLKIDICHCYVQGKRKTLVTFPVRVHKLTLQ